jgi:hypothetical protein
MDTFNEKPKRGETNHSNANRIAWGVIGGGTVLLLGNLGILGGILSLWPLALVGGGVWFLTQKGTKMEIKHEHYSAGIGDATSARVKLSLPVGETTIHGIDNASTLIDADMRFVGDMQFSVEGDSEKVLSLRQTGDSWTSWAKPSNWNWDTGRELYSTIGLNTSIPMILDINGGVGESRIDLSRVNSNHLNVSGGVGEIRLTLPAKGDSLDVRAEVGVGRMELTIPTNIGLNARVKGGIGETVINLPSDTAVRLEASNGIGDITVGSRFRQVSGNHNDWGIGKSGVWETTNFASASQKITIHYDGGIGQLTVR